jgi:hypothetical protein
MPGHIKVIRKAVSTAGTQVQLTTTTTMVMWAIFKAESSCYIGDKDVSTTTGRRLLSTDADLVIPPFETNPIQPFDLATIWVDVDSSGAAIQVTYLEAG